MVTREEVFRTLETLEADRIPCYVGAAEILRQTWAERVEFECELSAIREKLDLDGPELLTELLWHYGIGIATLEEMKARTIAVARGEIKPAPDEPKLWFSSIESMVESLKTIGGDHDDGYVELYEECVRAKRPMPQKD